MAPNSILTWNDMVDKFLGKYYPPGEALKRQSEIMSFDMAPQESIKEAWERFKGLLKRCPNHGLNQTHQILTFYRGCVPEAQRELNLSAGGSLLRTGEAEAMEVIERVTSNDEGWNNPRSKSYRVASASENNLLDLMSKQMELLNKKIDLMGMGMPQQEEPGRVEDVNYVHQGGNSFYTNNYRPNQGGGGGYNNYGYKTHPNLSYGNTSNTLKPPPGFQVSQGEIVEPKKMCSEDVLNAFMQETGRCFKVTNSRLERLEADVHSLTVHMKSVDTQLSQIAQAMSNQHTPGQLPSQPQTNPKDCKAIYLRSGTSYEGPSILELSSKAVEEPADVEQVAKEEGETAEAAGKEIERSEKNVPFPQLLRKQKQADKFSKFWDILKKVHVNIPLIDALKQIPGYAKFLKEAISKKKKWGDYETVNLAENCSAILQRKLPAKVKDPGSFTIECSIGDCFVGNALCDLGASINLMPLSLYKKLKLGPLKPTSITLQMADRSISHPKGIVEDILVRVNDFVFPADFVVLDMEEDRAVPLILGRPFLATGKALIDVENGELTFRFNDESVTFSIYDVRKRYEKDFGGDLHHCKAVSIVTDCRKEIPKLHRTQFLPRRNEEDDGKGNKRIKSSKSRWKI